LFKITVKGKVVAEALSLFKVTGLILIDAEEDISGSELVFLLQEQKNDNKQTTKNTFIFFRFITVALLNFLNYN